MLGLEVDMFVGGILVFPDDLIVLGQCLFQDSDHTSAFVQGEVIHSDIDGPAGAVFGPLVMSIEGVMGGCDGRREVLSELAFEHLYDIDQAFFELRCKFHDDA